jgi:hypothetical protein
LQTEVRTLSVDALIAAGPTLSTVTGAATLAVSEVNLSNISASGGVFNGVMGSDAYVAGSAGAGPLTYTSSGGYDSNNVNLGTVGSSAATASAAAYTASASPGSVSVANDAGVASGAADAAMATAAAPSVAAAAAASVAAAPVAAVAVAPA